MESITYLLELSLAPGETKAREHVERLQCVARQASAILNDAIHLAQACPPRPAFLNLNDVVADTLSDLDLTEEDSVYQELRLQLPKVMMDRSQACHMVANLVNFGRQIAVDGEPIVISTAQTASEVLLQLEFSAPDCRLDDLRSLFRPPLKLPASGAAMAMASMAQIVRAHGGRITVEGSKDRTSLLLAFPC